jgi:hypothetical protein
MPKQFNDLLSKVRKRFARLTRRTFPRFRIKIGKTAFSGFDPVSFHPHFLHANRNPLRLKMRLPLFTQPVLRIQLRLAPPDKRLETLESLFIPVIGDFPANCLDLAI